MKDMKLIHFLTLLLNQEELIPKMKAFYFIEEKKV